VVTGIAESDGKRRGTFVGGSDGVQTLSEDASLFNKNVVCTYYTAFSVSTSPWECLGHFSQVTQQPLRVLLKSLYVIHALVTTSRKRKGGTRD
jgi:hypothetical protein